MVFNQLFQQFLLIRGTRGNANPEDHQPIETLRSEGLRQRHAHAHAKLDRFVEIGDPVEVFTKHQIAALLIQLRFEVLGIRSKYEWVGNGVWKRLFQSCSACESEQHETIGHDDCAWRAAPALGFQLIEIETKVREYAVVDRF